MKDKLIKSKKDFIFLLKMKCVFTLNTHQTQNVIYKFDTNISYCKLPPIRHLKLPLGAVSVLNNNYESAYCEDDQPADTSCR